MSSKELFNLFIRERKFLRNVSPKTEEAYESAWSAIGKHLPEDPTTWKQEVFKEAVIRLMQRGLRPTSCNVHIRAMNAFLRWAAEENHLSTRHKISHLIQPKLVPAMFSEEQLSAMLNWKPFDITERRLYTLFTVIADTGIRIQEGLTLPWANIDFDNFFIKVLGKGRKERIIPISVECRKVLFSWKKLAPAGTWVFGTRNRTHLTYRNSLRDFEKLKVRLGIVGRRLSFHAIRHCFGTNFINSGGDAFKLQAMLGHENISTTRKYVHIAKEDLKRDHEQRSLLVKKAGR